MRQRRLSAAFAGKVMRITFILLLCLACTADDLDDIGFIRLPAIGRAFVSNNYDDGDDGLSHASHDVRTQGPELYGMQVPLRAIFVPLTPSLVLPASSCAIPAHAGRAPPLNLFF
jgi:hypothetical protein